MANLSFHEFIKRKIEGEKVCVEETNVSESANPEIIAPPISSADSAKALELAIAKKYIAELEKLANKAGLPNPISEKKEEIAEEPVYESKKKEINPDSYKLYRDKAEKFSCEIGAEGDAKLENTKARIIVEGEEWTLMFEGTIDERTGRCVIPLKKMDILEEGEKGNIRLEIIAGDTVFVPWKDEFVAISSKKISVKFDEQEQSKESSIKVSKIR